MKHFDSVFIFLDSVVDKNGAMLKFPDVGPFSDCATHSGKQAKQVYVVEQSGTKSHCCLAIVLGNMTVDFSEVA